MMMQQAMLNKLLQRITPRIQKSTCHKPKATDTWTKANHQLEVSSNWQPRTSAEKFSVGGGGGKRKNPKNSKKDRKVAL